MSTPERIARQKIDRLLQAAGWVLQDRGAFDRNAALGVAVREFQLPAGPCDYLLFVAGKAAGVIEAKKSGVTLGGVAEQSDKYMQALPDFLARWHDSLVFDYESTGEESFFRDLRKLRACESFRGPRGRGAFCRSRGPSCWLESALECPFGMSRNGWGGGRGVVR